MNVVTEDLPRIDEAQRVTVERLSDSFARVTLRFGFMEEPNVPRALAGVPGQGHGLRRHADLVLPVAPRPAPGAALADAALAGPPLHLARPLSERRQPVFRNSERAGGGGGHADCGLGGGGSG